jgi:hypothetical protein
MQKRTHKKILRLFGVGNDTDDGHLRITRSEQFDVLMGSEKTHEYISELCVQIDDQLRNEGKKIQDLTVQELRQVIQKLS